MARAAVMPPMMLGTHQNIVYVSSQGRITTTPPTILERYDVTTDSTTQIANMPNTHINEAQLSPDGQWILFVTDLKLQMIRMDGQELQTLYCRSGSATQISSVHQNGLWRVNTDGSGLARLTTEKAGDCISLNAFTQYPWSNFSHDGSMYSVRTTVFQGSSPPLYALIFGSLSAGTPNTFATPSNPGEGAVLEVIGWTAM